MSVVTLLRKSRSWDTMMSVFFHRCRYSCVCGEGMVCAWYVERGAWQVP